MGQTTQSISLFLADEGNKIRVIAGILKSDSDLISIYNFPNHSWI